MPDLVMNIKVRKDGSLGLPKYFRHVSGVKGGMGVILSWDSHSTSIIVRARKRACGNCGELHSDLDGTIGLCVDCMEQLEKHMHQGATFKGAMIAIAPKKTVRKRN